MAEFDLFAISDKEFEELCCDILAANFGVDVKSGKPGRDSGIDGVFRIGESRVVLQAKQYASDGYSSLRNVLKKSEVIKAKERVSGNRYILMTSCELNDDNRREIVQLYDGVIENEIDVWSGNDIRAKLAKPECKWVRRRHYNLWLGGIDALEEFLGSGIEAKSEDALLKIGEDLAHSVRTRLLEIAYSKLRSSRVLVITGQAGTGKTTLAKQLVMDSVLSDEYVFVEVDDDISVCERELAVNPDRKTLFFIDDFLGANCLDVLTGNRDSQIVRLIWRIKKRENCRLILTSRTNIINEAKDKYRSFDGAKIESMLFQLDDETLSRIDKAKILYNQMYFGDVDKDSKYCVIQNENYFKIIDHKNFNPRIISYCFIAKFAFDALRTGGRLGMERILWMLNNPREIWRDCIMRLNLIESYLVQIVFLASSADGFLLETAWKRLMQCDSCAQYRGVAFEDVMRKLCGSVLASVVLSQKGGRRLVYKLFNPSVGDYLIENHMTDCNLIAELALLYQDVDVAVSLWRELYWGSGAKSRYNNACAEAGRIILNKLSESTRGLDTNFVLGSFKELAQFYRSSMKDKLSLGRRIAEDGVLFNPDAEPTLVANYLHWAYDNCDQIFDDERMTKTYLDGLVVGINEAEALVMLNRGYEYHNYMRPNGYYDKIKEHGAAWADEIAQSLSWDSGTSATAVYEDVAERINDFLQECEVDEDILSCDECCEKFNPDAYVPEDANWSEPEEEDWGGMGLSAVYENSVIRRIFNGVEM